MKRIVVALLGISMCAALVGCGNIQLKKDAQKTTEIQILTGTATEAEKTEKKTEKESETKAEKETVRDTVKTDVQQTQNTAEEQVEIKADDDKSPETIVNDSIAEVAAGVDDENEVQAGYNDTGNVPVASVSGDWPDVMRIVNLRGDETTVYLLADGRYMDREERVFTYNGSDAWYDADGVEWNEKL